jgi:hypothetical protein
MAKEGLDIKMPYMAFTLLINVKWLILDLMLTREKIVDL